MHETGKKLLQLMFRPGETICISNNKYGYHSIPLSSALSEKATLVSPNPKVPIAKVSTNELLLVALNPIHGYREDINCLKFRNFMVELDSGQLKEQLEYIKKIGLPYSACIFSGSKSLHFLVSLDQDLPNENVWRTMAEWILNIATMADSNTKNPSRSLRIPGAYREPGKKQRLVEFKGPVKLSDLASWLAKRPDCKPKAPEKRQISEKPDFHKIKNWALKKLINLPNLSKNNRNSTWFSLAVEFALAGYIEEDIISILEEYYTEERDFKRKEWISTVRSGIKYAIKKYE